MFILDKAMKIVNEKEAFYYRDEVVGGEVYRIFNYRLPTFKDFKDDVFALELRGLTIHIRTGVYYLGLHKFFNNNENDFTQGDTLCRNKVLECQEKLDGSLIQCIVNKKRIFTKTKGTFFSEQAQIAQKIIDENSDYYYFIQDLFSRGIFVFFELVSPFNQVVIPYTDTKLVCIQARNRKGEYMSYDILKGFCDKHNIPIASVEYYTLKEIKHLQKTKTGVEGWVVYNPEESFERQFRKFKTDEYFALHRILAPEKLAENKVIEYVLNETIDDVISQLPNGEKREKVIYITDLVSNYFDYKVKEILALFNKRLEYTRKEFAIKYKNYEYFNVVVSAKNMDDVERLFKEKILKNTYRLEKAREFVKRIENDRNISKI